MNFENLVLVFHVLTIQSFPVQSIWILTNGCLRTIKPKYFSTALICLFENLYDKSRVRSESIPRMECFLDYMWWLIFKEQNLFWISLYTYCIINVQIELLKVYVIFTENYYLKLIFFSVVKKHGIRYLMSMWKLHFYWPNPWYLICKIKAKDL